MRIQGDPRICLSQFVLPVLVFYLLCWSTAASQSPSCDVNTYGKPGKTDCQILFEKFTNPQNLQTRIFVEEQLRAESDKTWPEVANVFDQPIVQLPKYYAMNTCNFALMPYTDPVTLSANPLDVNSWATIKSSGNSLILDCLDKKAAGGEISIKSGISTSPGLVLFMWASGASFEAKLNEYENNPRISVQLTFLEAGVNGTDGSGVRVA